jgi:hypothetical protein
MWFDSQEKNKI